MENAAARRTHRPKNGYRKTLVNSAGFSPDNSRARTKSRNLAFARSRTRNGGIPLSDLRNVLRGSIRS
jgi:hypothetical protein